jgi:hypothetical protein
MPSEILILNESTSFKRDVDEHARDIDMIDRMAIMICAHTTRSSFEKLSLHDIVVRTT